MYVMGMRGTMMRLGLTLVGLRCMTPGCLCLTVLPTVYFVPLGMQVCFVYVHLVGGSTILLGLTSPDIDLVGLRIITLATLVIILISLMKSLTYL